MFAMDNPINTQQEPGNLGRGQMHKGAAGLHQNILAQTKKHRVGNTLMGKKSPPGKAKPQSVDQKGVNPFAKKGAM